MPGVLTKKQSWRRQGICSRRRHHDLIYQEGFAKGDLKTGTGPRSFSEQSFHGPPLLHSNSKPWGTTGNLQEHKQDLFGNKLKSVMFSARVHIILIPSIEEYEAAGLAEHLWWADDDYKDFKQSALNEVKDYMSLRSISDSKDAIRLLYQNMQNDDLELVSTPHTPPPSTNTSEQVANSTQSTITTCDVPSSSSSGKNPPIPVIKPEAEGNRLFNCLRKSQSFCLSRSSDRPLLPPSSETITSMALPFRSKTDVDIIHSKSNDEAYEDFLRRLRKLHSERRQQQQIQAQIQQQESMTDEIASTKETPVHPLALICS